MSLSCVSSSSSRIRSREKERYTHSLVYTQERQIMCIRKSINSFFWHSAVSDCECGVEWASEQASKSARKNREWDGKSLACINHRPSNESDKKSFRIHHTPENIMCHVFIVVHRCLAQINGVGLCLRWRHWSMASVCHCLHTNSDVFSTQTRAYTVEISPRVDYHSTLYTYKNSLIEYTV